MHSSSCLRGCAAIALVLFGLSSALLAQTGRPDHPRIIQSARPALVYYERGGPLYLARETAGGVAIACSNSDLDERIAQSPQAQVLRLKRRRYCGSNAPATVQRLTPAPVHVPADAIISAVDGVRSSGYTILPMSGLALEAAFPAALPDQDIALFSRAITAAYVYVTADGRLHGLDLVEQETPRRLRLLSLKHSLCQTTQTFPKARRWLKPPFVKRSAMPWPKRCAPMATSS